MSLRAATLLLTLPLAAASAVSTRRALGHHRIQVQGRQLLMDGTPFMVRGVCYSPVPINESVYFAPYGDYFAADYSFIWLRDLPLIKEMGANVVRTYGWQPNIDHVAFLDALADHDLYGMATFYMGDHTETPVRTAAQRQKVVDTFLTQVKKYADHPSLLFWSFGNELNGVWNGFLTELGESLDMEPNYGKSCHWDERYDDLGGCWVHKGNGFAPGSRCYEAGYCVYSRLFSFINDAAAAAKKVADVLVVSAFADVDQLFDKVDRAGDKAAALDAWTAQVYRGSTFGDFFTKMGNATDKPTLLTEYGVDAYHDVCGKDMESKAPCYNTVGDTSGSYEDEEAQALFARNLTREIEESGTLDKECAKAKKGDFNCTAIGGFLMSWTDEYWKGAKSQAACDPVITDDAFSEKHCDLKAHVTCGNWNASDHDLCGYFLEASPDHYVNEEWFGITAPTTCVDSINELRPRQIYWDMRLMWTGQKKKRSDLEVWPTCDKMLTGWCTDLGNGGKDDSWSWLFGAVQREAGDDGMLECSGRGSCTSDWKKCGAGASDEIATPCCRCDLGFAGIGCTELDVRVYVVFGGASILAILLLSMTLTSIASAIGARVRKSPLHERLLS